MITGHLRERGSSKLAKRVPKKSGRRVFAADTIARGTEDGFDPVIGYWFPRVE